MVKTILKRNNILLSQFAGDLHISRPTLDTYIRSYDSGIKLSNKLYQKIFDYLFKDPTLSYLEFRKRYEYIVAHYGSAGEIKLSGQSQSFTVLEKIIADGSIKTLLTNDELNTLGDLIVNKDSLFFHLLKIRLVLANKVDLMSLSDKDKMLTVGMYELSTKLNKQDFSYNEDSYKQLEQAINKRSHVNNNKEIKEKLVNTLVKIIDDEVENDDLDSVVSLIQSLKQQ